jgi:GT2 family glycosyltransferase
VPVPVSIVIPTWNGRPLLEKFLPSVIACAEYRQTHERAPVELIVVDDGGTDNTKEWLADVARACVVPLRYVRQEQNLGFGAAANLGVREAVHPYVWLLNNDVEVDDDGIGRLAASFETESPRLLAVHSAMADLASGQVVGTGKMGGFSRGFLRVHRSYIPTTGAEGPFPSMFATGGSALFQRSLFLELGGFDAIFAPFYMEDVELSYRAWKRGCEIRFEPRSVVRHQFSSTIAARPGRRVERISHRNRLLFHWIHLHDRRYLASHAFWLLVLAMSAPLTLKGDFLGGLMDAIRLVPSVRSRRRDVRRAATRTDRDVLNIFKELDGSGAIRSYGDKREVDLTGFERKIKKRPA